MDRSFWLSPLEGLNDPHETRVGLELAYELLSDIPGAPDKLSIDHIDSTISRDSIFQIGCFSEVGDSLSQWSGYAPRGWCLEFSTRWLQEAVAQAWHPDGGPQFLERVRYRRSEQIELLDSWLDEAEKTVLESHQNVAKKGLPRDQAEEGRLLGLGTDLRRPTTIDRSGLGRGVALMKSPQWEDEREIRFLVNVPMEALANDSPYNRCPGITPATNERPPRAAVSLDCGTGPYPLLRIIVAPGMTSGSDVESRIEVAEALLKEAGLPTIPVEESKIRVHGALVPEP